MTYLLPEELRGRLLELIRFPESLTTQEFVEMCDHLSALTPAPQWDEPSPLDRENGWKHSWKLLNDIADTVYEAGESVSLEAIDAILSALSNLNQSQLVKIPEMALAIIPGSGNPFNTVRTMQKIVEDEVGILSKSYANRFPPPPEPTEEKKDAR